MGLLNIQYFADAKTAAQNQATLTEYLFILTIIDIIRKAQFNYVDQYAAFQYLSQTKPFELSDTTLPLMEQFAKNHSVDIQNFIMKRYCEVLQNIVSYMRKSLLNEQKYGFVPLTPAVRQSVLTFLHDKKDAIIGSFNHGWQNTQPIISEIETTAAMLEGHFGVYRNMQNDETYTYHKDSAQRSFNNREIIINPQVFEMYMKHLSVFSSNMYSTNNKDNEFHIRHLVNVLSIFMHLVCPIGCYIDSNEEMYHRHIKEVAWDPKVYKFMQMVKHLSGININNVICSDDEILYDLRKDIKSGYDLDSLVERYLILNYILTHKDL